MPTRAQRRANRARKQRARRAKCTRDAFTSLSDADRLMVHNKRVDALEWEADRARCGAIAAARVSDLLGVPVRSVPFTGYMGISWLVEVKPLAGTPKLPIEPACHVCSTLWRGRTDVVRRRAPQPRMSNDADRLLHSQLVHPCVAFQYTLNGGNTADLQFTREIALLLVAAAVWDAIPALNEPGVADLIAEYATGYCTFIKISTVLD
jgi:hypothetical protein